MQIEILNDPHFIFVCLCLATLRVYLELIGFDFKKLPVTSRAFGEGSAKFHKTGLYFSVGYILLFAPQALLS